MENQPNTVKRTEESVKTFLDQYATGPSSNKKRIKTLISLSDDEYECYKLNVVVSQCCKVMDIPSAMEAYSTLKAKNLIPSKDTYLMLISLVAGLGEPGSGSCRIRENEPPSDPISANIVFQDMKLHQIPIIESCYTAMIRCYSSHNQLMEALKLFYEMTETANISPKLRTYSSLFLALASIGDIENGFKLYENMTMKYDISPSEKEYGCLLKLTTKHEDNRFYTVLEQMMEDILVPTTQSWSIFKDWFTSSHVNYQVIESEVNKQGIIAINNQQLLSIDLDSETRLNLLHQIESFAFNRAYTKSKNIVHSKVNDLISSISSKPEDAVDIIDVLANDRNSFDNQAINISSSSSSFSSSSSSLTSSMKSESKWFNYVSWLSNRSDNYTIVVDGANVGFYKQNYAGAPSHVDYYQINWLLEQLKRDGQKPLLILHQRHTNQRSVPEITKYLPIINSWRESNMIYETPSGWNDDWFWMYACVKLQCHIVTNDEMRDHHFQMLSPRWFSRWKERHVVHFRFGKWMTSNQKLHESSDMIHATNESILSIERISQENTNNEPVAKRSRHDITILVDDDKGTSDGSIGNSYREAIFDFPLVFSYRMQLISRPSSNDKENLVSREFYFPAADKTTWLCAIPSHRTR